MAGLVGGDHADTAQRGGPPFLVEGVSSPKRKTKHPMGGLQL